MTSGTRSALAGLLVLLALSAPAPAVTCASDAFIAASEYAVTSFSPDQMVVADFDGDGLADIATFGEPYYYLGSISVLLGNPDGTFQPARTVATVPEYGYALVGGLFDAGDTVDLVASLGDGDVAFFAGNGDGTFQLPVLSSFPDPAVTLGALATGDFNDDGDLDLAVTGGSGGASILLGNGDGTFVPPVWFPAGVPTGTLAVGDVDGNGTLDVATGGGGSSVAILLGDGNGSLGPAQSFSAGSQLWDVHLADLDGNGDLDIAVTCGTYAGVLLGNGDGTFQAARKFPGGPNPQYLGIADFDGDGVPDLAVGSSGAGAVKILLGVGNGNFVPGQMYSVSPSVSVLAVADFGDDGLADVAVSGGSQSIVSVLSGNGDGTLRGVRTEALGFFNHVLAQGDFNGDGFPDLAGAGENPTIRIMLGTPTGGFALGQALAASNYNSPVAVGDFDGDAIADLITADYSNALLYPGIGDGTFGDAVTLPGPSYSIRAISVADFNGDGKLDFALLTDNGSAIVVALGNGNGTFQSYLTSAGPAQVSAAIVADLDGDGVPDIVTSNGIDCCYGSSTVTVSIGLGDGTFASPVPYATGSFPTGVAAADFNDDAILDLATADRDDTVALLFGNGDGTFGQAQFVGLGSRPWSIVAADFDGDGQTDIVTANTDSSTATLLRGLGDGAFETPTIYRVGSEPGPALVADLFANGVPDVVTGNGDGIGGVSLLVNTRLGVGFLPAAGACDGLAATLNAYAAGFGPLSYQWRKDGGDLSDGGHVSGATTAVLTLDPATPADDGAYDVVVTDACGTVISNAAPFTVTTPPPPPAISIDSPPAPGVAGTASVPSVAGHTYTWSIHGDTDAIITSGQGTAQITFLAQIPGAATLDVTEFSSPGCGTASAVAAVPVDFFDVPPGHPFHDDIVTIARDDITAGCGGGNYCPADPVTRAQMAVFLLKSKNGPDWTPQEFGPIFADVPNGSFACFWINNLWNISVTSGCGDDNYCPDASVTRAQMAVFILKTLGEYYPPQGPQIFDDVPPGSFASNFIDALYNQGITGGCSVIPKLYCPDGIVNRGQMAVFLVRAFLEPAP